MNKTIFMFRHYARFPPWVGGHQHFSLAQCMANDGFKVYLFISNFNHSTKLLDKDFGGLFFEERVGEISIIWINNKPLYKSNGLRRLVGMLDYSIKCFLAAKSISKKDSPADIIMGSVAHTFAILSAWCYARKFRIPLWIDISELWPEAYVHSGVLSERHPLVYLLGELANRLFRKANIITVINPNTIDFIAAHRGVPRDKVCVFVPGFECGEYPQCAPMLKLPENAPLRVTYSGSFGELYPLEELLAAVRDLVASGHKIEILLVGDGAKIALLRALVTEYGITSAVRFVPPVEKSELWNLYANSDLLLVIEKDVKYGFPSKLLDYFNAGRPILIASEADYCLPDQIFMTCAPTSCELQDALTRFMSLDADTRKQLGASSFIYAKDNFKTSSQYVQVIRHKLHALVVR